MNKITYKKILLILLIIILTLFLIRLFNSRELDDVSPRIACEESLVEKADVLWIVPNYDNFSISENKEWCFYILGLNKTIGMHGVNHQYNEFAFDREQEYLEDGIRIFGNCFGSNPTIFKSPQLKVSAENKKLIKENKMDLKGKINQMMHKVYHCDDSGDIKNWLIDLF